VLPPGWPGMVSTLPGPTLPCDVGEEPVEPPDNARRIGALGLHRIAYSREPATQPAQIIGRKGCGFKKPLSHKQPRSHTIGGPAGPERRQLESPDKVSPRPQITPVNINGQQNRGVRIDHSLQFSNGLRGQADGQYASIHQVMADGIRGLGRDKYLESGFGRGGDCTGGRRPLSAHDQDRRAGIGIRGGVTAPGRDGPAGPGAERTSRHADRHLTTVSPRHQRVSPGPPPRGPPGRGQERTPSLPVRSIL
jgi:hypothetical protein